MDGLNEDFILSGEEMVDIEGLFNEDSQEETKTEESVNTEEEKETTEEEIVDAENLFDTPEGVGSEDKDNQEKEDTNSEKDGGTSPKTNFYSSIASALKDEGIFPDLDDETLKSINEPEDFAEAVEKQIQARLDERQRRIDAALNADIEPEEIKKYENTLSYLDSIKEEDITAENDKGEMLRQKLIYQDFRNRGYSDARAQREVQKSLNAGTDVEDAKEALEENRKYFTESYQELIKEAQEEAKAEERRVKEQAEKLKKVMLEDKEVFEGIPLDKVTRQKAFDNIAKPVFKTEDGEYDYQDPGKWEYLTTIGKYERDNPVEFKKYLSVLFTLTDGFKNLDGLVKGKVKKEVKQSLRELEHKLSSSSRSSAGNPRYVGGIEEDNESYIGNGWTPDV